MLKAESDGPVLRLTINRPEVRNALNDELIASLHAAVVGIEPSVRAIVLTGEGSSFCAGGDLAWMQKAATYTEEQNYEDALRLAQLFHAIASSHALVIARVNGHCFGGGCGLVAAADVGIAQDSALFAFSEVKLALVPATISPFVLAKIGSGAARALFATGEAFGAERALRIGLVHEVVEQDKLDAAVEAKLAAVLSAGPRAVGLAKKLAQEPPLSLKDSARLLSRIRSTEEAREGVSAFLEKRRPSFAADRKTGPS